MKRIASAFGNCGPSIRFAIFEILFVGVPPINLRGKNELGFYKV